MEIRIVIFLAFVSVTLVTNTLLIIFAYKVFAGMTSKLTATMSSFSQTGETRELIQSLQVAAERAATITESTKSRIAGFDPVLARLQENYRGTLATADSKLETVAGNINTSAQKIRDVIATPAFAAASFVAGLTKLLKGEL
jgi:hypothetical protein